MSAKLLIVALICAVAYAQAGVISRTSYNKGDCTGTGFTSNTTTGVCTNYGTTFSSAEYFDSSNIYSTYYNGVGCNGTILSVTQVPLGCGTQTFGTSITVSGSSEALPFGSFPPSGYSSSSSFYNTSALLAKATACSTGSGVVEVKTASSTACIKRGTNTYYSQPSSTSGFCSADGTQSGAVVFSDATCQTPASGSSSAIGSCVIDQGVATKASCGSTPTFPSSLPTTGYIQYTNDDCSSSNPTTVYIGATCFDSQTLVCGAVNGTDGYATYTASSPVANGADGTCGGVQRAQHVSVAGTCFKYGTLSRKYFCTSDGPGASASTASVSMVALLIAAVAAVFSVRSL